MTIARFCSGVLTFQLANNSKLLTDFSIQGRSSPGDLHEMSHFSTASTCLSQPDTHLILKQSNEDLKGCILQQNAKAIGFPSLCRKTFITLPWNSGICSPLNGQGWRTANKQNFRLEFSSNHSSSIPA